MWSIQECKHQVILRSKRRKKQKFYRFLFESDFPDDGTMTVQILENWSIKVKVSLAFLLKKCSKVRYLCVYIFGDFSSPLEMKTHQIWENAPPTSANSTMTPNTSNQKVFYILIPPVINRTHPSALNRFPSESIHT